MNKNEVVALLSAIIIELNEDGNFVCDTQHLKDVTKKLRETIRCVELVDELVHAFEISTKIAESRGYNIEKARELIKKAKGEE